jgi:molybdenum cofactor cytidylyltransferase
MGSPKALLQYHGECFLDRLTGLFAAVCHPVIVVLGHESETIRTGVRHPERAHFVENPDYRLGQLTSMQRGLQEVPLSAEGVLFTLVDHPSVSPETLHLLAAEPDAVIAIPRHRGRRGHPMYFHRSLIQEFLDLPANSQAREVVHRHTAAIRYLDVDDPGILADIDDPAAYQRLIGVS